MICPGYLYQTLAWPYTRHWPNPGVRTPQQILHSAAQKEMWQEMQNRENKLHSECVVIHVSAQLFAW